VYRPRRDVAQIQAFDYRDAGAEQRAVDRERGIGGGLDRDEVRSHQADAVIHEPPGSLGRHGGHGVREDR
jgi:hypothetical protein